MLLGLTTPWPASAKPPSGDGTKRLGPCSASSPCAATRAVAGAAAISTIASAQARRDRDDVEAARVERGERDRDARREMLDAHVLVLGRDRVDELVPRRRRRRRRGAALRVSAIPNAASIAHSADASASGEDEGDVVAVAEAHARHLRAQVELAHHLGERGLLGAGDEHGVRAEDRRARRRRGRSARPARTRRRRTCTCVSSIVEPVQPGDRVEREARPRPSAPAPSRLRSRMRLSPSRLMPSPPAKTSSSVTPPPASARSLKRRNAAVELVALESDCRCSAHARANAWRPECLPSGSVIRTPTDAGSMIWYVRASFSIPSWWMPASCANAFAPTIALFGCTA